MEYSMDKIIFTLYTVALNALQLSIETNINKSYCIFGPIMTDT